MIRALDQSVSHDAINNRRTNGVNSDLHYLRGRPCCGRPPCPAGVVASKNAIVPCSGVEGKWIVWVGGETLDTKIIFVRGIAMQIDLNTAKSLPSLGLVDSTEKCTQ